MSRPLARLHRGINLVRAWRRERAAAANHIPRPVVIQGILDLFDQPAYLEVGVCDGHTFHTLRARRKVAVDPAFRFDHAAAAAQHPSAIYHRVTSDFYFGELAGNERFDVIYLDGLHTFEQTLRDLLNALGHISADGIIIVDDIFPSTLAAAMPDLESFSDVRARLNISSELWMGDVYKLVLFVDSFLQGWSFACIGDNHGQMVLWQTPRAAVRERRVEEIGLAGYERAVIERDSFRFAPYSEILAQISLARTPARS